MNEHDLILPDLETRSPWANNDFGPIVTIQAPTQPIDAALSLSGSKSMTNRALIIAAMAEGTSVLTGLLKCDDSYWCIESLSRLGAEIQVDGETAYVKGTGGNWPNRNADLYVGAAGTVARFLPAALATGNGTWRITGSKRMHERPLAPLFTALSTLGADLQYEQAAGSLPVTLNANGLCGGEVAISGSVSSQFTSGLLLAAPYARKELTIRMLGEVVQRDYVEMTLDMMRSFGCEPLLRDGGQAVVVPQSRYQAQSLTLEPDVSACGYFWALAAITGGRIRISRINPRTKQPDLELVDVLERMGCSVMRGSDYIEVRGPKQLKGGFTQSMARFSDQTLTLAAIAPFADQPITLTDAAHIRHHECDRIRAICTELRKLGIRVQEHHDGLTVYPSTIKPALVETYDDHRMAMSLSLIGTKQSGVRIADPGCVSKTCPEYFAKLASLGVGVLS